jgi:prepilin-type N-terminal cleavage/methylation domain-containing protein
MRNTVAVRAFTLIEMAIVLVIVGLLVGSILAGRTLIRQSQINSSMADIQQYTKATLAFRDKYAALPGDMANATSYWGATATPSPSACNGVQGTGTQTCDGDGNGQIGTALTANYEQLRFWQHLADAQLIAGTYTGVGDTNGTYDSVPGVNVPKSRIDGGGYSVYYVGVNATAGILWTGTFGHIFTLGGYVSGNTPYAPVLTAEEASAYDLKFDDGLPTTGNVQSFDSLNPNCTTNASGSYLYKLSATGAVCSLIFISGF